MKKIKVPWMTKPWVLEFKYKKNHPITKGVGFGPFRLYFETWEEVQEHYKFLKEEVGVDKKSIVMINKLQAAKGIVSPPQGEISFEKVSDKYRYVHLGD